MKRMNQLLLCMLCLACPVVAHASQLITIDADTLEPLSDVIVVGTVSKVEQDKENTIPKEITDYDIVTVTVAFALKGSVSTKTLQVRLASRGNRAFDPTLTKGETATFFLKKAEGEVYRTAYPGSVSLFPKGYFKESKKKDSEPEN